MPKYRKMLNDWQAPYVLRIMRLIETQSKLTIANWCIAYAEMHLLPFYEAACPGDLRPKAALVAAKDYLDGKNKLPEVKAAVAQCRTAAAEAEKNPTAQAAVRAIGQCAATVHTASNSAGLMLYGALALAYDKLGADEEWDKLLVVAEEECGRMEAALREVAVEDEPNPAKINWNC